MSYILFRILFVLFFLIISTNIYADENNVTDHIVTLEKNCSENDYVSCLYAGQIFENTGLMILAITAYEKACDNKVYEACVKLADVYIDDEDKAVRKKALKLYSKACKNNIARSCSSLGHIYFSYNETVKQNYKKSKKLFEKACNLLDKTACYNAALMYENGIGTKKNIKSALEYFYRSCYMHYNNGCKKYNTILNRIKEING